MPLLSLIMERQGIPGSIIGANTAMAGLANIIIAPFTGRLVVRFGVVSLLSFAVLLTCLSFAGFWLFAPSWLWFPLRFLFGIAIGLLFILSEFWINALVDEHRRGLVMGIYGTVLSVGFAAGPAILVVTGSAGAPPFIVGLALFALGALPILFGARAAPRITERSRRPFTAYFLVAPAATLAGLVFGAIESANFSLLPIYGLRLGLSAGEAATLITMMALGSVILQIPLGLLADRMDRQLLLLLCALAGTLCAALLPIIGTLPLAAHALIFLFGGIVGGLYTVGLAHLGSRFRGADLAAANGVFVMLYSIGMLIGPAGTGAGLDLMPPHGFVVAMLAFLLIFCAVVGGRMVAARAGRSVSGA